MAKTGTEYTDFKNWKSPKPRIQTGWFTADRYFKEAVLILQNKKQMKLNLNSRDSQIINYLYVDGEPLINKANALVSKDIGNGYFIDWVQVEAKIPADKVYAYYPDRAEREMMDRAGYKFRSAQTLQAQKINLDGSQIMTLPPVVDGRSVVGDNGNFRKGVQAQITLVDVDIFASIYGMQQFPKVDRSLYAVQRQPVPKPETRYPFRILKMTKNPQALFDNLEAIANQRKQAMQMYKARLTVSRDDSTRAIAFSMQTEGLRMHQMVAKVMTEKDGETCIRIVNDGQMVGRFNVLMEDMYRQILNQKTALWVTNDQRLLNGLEKSDRMLTDAEKEQYQQDYIQALKRRVDKAVADETNKYKQFEIDHYETIEGYAECLSYLNTNRDSGEMFVDDSDEEIDPEDFLKQQLDNMEDDEFDDEDIHLVTKSIVNTQIELISQSIVRPEDNRDLTEKEFKSSIDNDKFYDKHKNTGAIVLEIRRDIKVHKPVLGDNMLKGAALQKEFNKILTTREPRQLILCFGGDKKVGDAILKILNQSLRNNVNTQIFFNKVLKKLEARQPYTEDALKKQAAARQLRKKADEAVNAADMLVGSQKEAALRLAADLNQQAGEAELIAVRAQKELERHKTLLADTTLISQFNDALVRAECIDKISKVLDGKHEIIKFMFSSQDNIKNRVYNEDDMRYQVRIMKYIDKDLGSDASTRLWLGLKNYPVALSGDAKSIEDQILQIVHKMTKFDKVESDINSYYQKVTVK